MGMGLRVTGNGRDGKEVEVSRSLEVEKLTLNQVVVVFKRSNSRRSALFICTLKAKKVRLELPTGEGDVSSRYCQTVNYPRKEGAIS